MSKKTSLGLIVAGVVLLVVGLIEHLALRAEVVPHLAIYLGVLAVLAVGVGLFGIVSRRGG